MAGPGHAANAALRQYEKIEKEYLVVRRYRDPIWESMERLKKLHAAAGKTPQAHNAGPSPKKRNRPRDGTRTPGAESTRSGTSSNNTGVSRTRVSFALSAPDDEEDETEHPVDWHSMTIEELEEATLNIRRQMWELHSAEEGE